jgi:hypothetical protein
MRHGHANQAKSGHGEKTKANLYEEITARIIADLETGVFPWAQPWGSGPENAAHGLPRNAATGKSYCAAQPQGAGSIRLRDHLKGEGRERVEGFLPRNMAFPIGGNDLSRPCKSPRAGRLLSLCLPVNKATDSGADAWSAPEFASLRVAKESIVPNQI